MKTLLLIRHAKSSPANLGQKDFDRSLNPRGIADAQQMAKKLKIRIDKIDLFISSPAMRTRATLDFFIAEYNYSPQACAFVDSLYLPGGQEFKDCIKQIEPTINIVAIVSHNDGITTFANSLSNTKIDNMPTCGIFAVQAAGNSWEKFAETEKLFLFFDYPKAGLG